MTKAINDYKGRHFHPSTIHVSLRWYLRYPLTYRDLVEMMEKRGVNVAHATIIRWIHKYSPTLHKGLRRNPIQRSS